MPWALLLLTAAAPPAVETAVSPSVTWVGTVQVGVGRVCEDAALLVKPRLAYVGERGELVVAAPLWLEIADLPPRSDNGATTRDPRWLSAWDDPETYASMLERLAWVSPEGAVRVAAGKLSQETLGRGILVDHFEGTLEPTRPRTGGRADLDLDLLGATVLADSFVRPHLVAGRVVAAPFRLAGYDSTSRLELGLETALDPRAPTARGPRAAGGGALDVGVEVWRGAGVVVEPFVAGAWLGGWGAHLGVAADWTSDDARYALALKLELVGAGEGYLPGYFDGAYSFERYGERSGHRVAKADWRPRAALGLRGALDACLGPVRFGLSAAARDARGTASAAAYLRIVQPRWSAAATLTQRSIAGAGDLVTLDASAHAMVEGAVLVWRGLFVFSQLRRGPRREPGGLPRVEADWLLGVGWGGTDG
jgi:hypothetical protein